MRCLELLESREPLNSGPFGDFSSATRNQSSPGEYLPCKPFHWLVNAVLHWMVRDTNRNRPRTHRFKGWVSSSWYNSAELVTFHQSSVSPLLRGYHFGGKSCYWGEVLCFENWWLWSTFSLFLSLSLSLCPPPPSLHCFTLRLLSNHQGPAASRGHHQQHAVQDSPRGWDVSCK